MGFRLPVLQSGQLRPAWTVDVWGVNGRPALGGHEVAGTGLGALYGFAQRPNGYHRTLETAGG
jgi:hypothetical protein